MVAWVLRKVVSVTESVIKGSPDKMAPLEAVRRRIQSGRVWVVIWGLLTILAQGMLSINTRKYARSDPPRPNFAVPSSISDNMLDLMFASHEELFHLGGFTTGDLVWMNIRYVWNVIISSHYNDLCIVVIVIDDG